LFGYKNPDDGREREIIAEHAWFNFKKEVVAETAKLVAREVLSGLKEITETPAYKSLRSEHGQLDEDGIVVAVSRQAIVETCTALEAILQTLEESLNK
jgi:hypothetical protein